MHDLGGSDVEFDVRSLQTSDLLLLLVVHISKDRVRTLEICQYRWL